MSKMKFIACALAIACAAPAANATVITFNDLAGTAVPGNTAVYSYTEFSNTAAIVNGFSFKATNTWGYLFGPDVLGNDPASYQPYNGNDYYMGNGGFTMQSSTPANFSVSSLDLALWNGGTMAVTLTGTRANGSTVTQNVSATIDNRTSTDDFIHVTLDGFTNIKSLKFSGTNLGYLAIDNIAVNETAVPEPGSLALLGLGLAAFAGLRRRKG